MALKWRQIKSLMHRDIQSIKKQSNGHKIVTKAEWMCAALEELEKKTLLNLEETPKYLYDSQLIDPSKLTPFQ